LSYDSDDVSITGVTVDRAERRDIGSVRYWYSDDGESLPHGRIHITQVGGSVTDLAGNGNPERTDIIARLRTTCTWNNPDHREDVDTNLIVAPFDVLIIVNQLNRVGAGPLPVPAHFPNVPPPFYDTNCNDILEPFDVLLVINYINAGNAGPVREGESAGINPLAGVRKTLTAEASEDIGQELPAASCGFATHSDNCFVQRDPRLAAARPLKRAKDVEPTAELLVAVDDPPSALTHRSES
jgi:hypothetical protein